MVSSTGVEFSQVREVAAVDQPSLDNLDYVLFTCRFSTGTLTMSNHIPNRREFLAAAGVAAVGSVVASEAGSELPSRSVKNMKLGFDNFSIRAFGWKAPQLIDYAISVGADVLLMSDLDVYESNDVSYFRMLKEKADKGNLQLHVGTGSINPGSRSFDKKRWKSGEEHITHTINIAKMLGSPVARCYQGTAEDRKSPGGIPARIEEMIRICRNVRSVAQDAGVKIAIENHAGDMQAWELAGLIETAGADYVGATMDAGNATWTLEDPIENLRILGKYSVTTGIRDSAVWENAEGSISRWTAVGDGMVDFAEYLRVFREVAPQCPFVLEIISEFQRPLPYYRDDFWVNYGDIRPREFAMFLKMARKGKERPAYQMPQGEGSQKILAVYQKEQLEKSLKYCRNVLGIGSRV